MLTRTKRKTVASWLSRQRPANWTAYTLAGATVSVHALLPSGFLTVPLYGLTTAGLMTLDQHKAKTPKRVYQLAMVAILTAFIWCSIALAHPVHALVFNRISAGLTTAISAFGVAGLDKVPAWVTQFFVILAFVAIGGLIVGWLKTRQGDDEENNRAINKAIGIVVKLLIGDVLLSLIGV